MFDEKCYRLVPFIFVWMFFMNYTEVSTEQSLDSALTEEMVAQAPE